MDKRDAPFNVEPIEELINHALERLEVCQKWGYEIDRSAVLALYSDMIFHEREMWSENKRGRHARFDPYWYQTIDDLLCLSGVMASRKKGLQWKRWDDVMRKYHYPIYEAVGQVLHISASAVKKSYLRARKTYKDDLPAVFRPTQNPHHDDAG